MPVGFWPTVLGTCSDNTSIVSDPCSVPYNVPTCTNAFPVCNGPRETSNLFSVVYYNARNYIAHPVCGILPKLDELCVLAKTINPDIICIVESWLCEEIQDSEIALHGYLIFQKDRNRHGGSVLI